MVLVVYPQTLLSIFSSSLNHPLNVIVFLTGFPLAFSAEDARSPTLIGIITKYELLIYSSDVHVFLPISTNFVVQSQLGTVLLACIQKDVG